MDDRVRRWIIQRYYADAFTEKKFIGWVSFTRLLVQQAPDQETEIRLLLKQLRSEGHGPHFEEPNQLFMKKRNQLKAERKATAAARAEVERKAQAEVKAGASEAANIPTTNTGLGWERSGPNQSVSNILVVPARSMTSMSISSDDDDDETMTDPTSISSPIQVKPPVKEEPVSSAKKAQLGPNLHLLNMLVAKKNRASGESIVAREIKHAPLVTAELVVSDDKSLLPQYGLLGTMSDEGNTDLEGNKVFQNTNVPFSTFICGLQGSGKSHTTACMLENVLLRSPYLGKLGVPAAALIFSYGEFSSGGLGFNISEATWLAVSNKAFPGHRVSKINVLASPSNPAIRKHYEKVPGVVVQPFRLNPKSLDIGTLRNLMAVSNSKEEPLYLARVESILRAIASNNTEGVLDYALFKRALIAERFDPVQRNMLNMRLNLLESFLDNSGKTSTAKPQFEPGDVTIIDLSDPFVTAHTACILFKLALDRFMQSDTPSKMIVLDEAHKYMLDNPGAKELTNALKTLVRLQRHKGARVVISTQEPTISTELIALCSTTIIHRFTSPAWLAALSQHIAALKDGGSAMEQIENLETGQALVYCPSAVVGKTGDGGIDKATGRLLKLDVRRRVTRDGGDSVMAA